MLKYCLRKWEENKEALEKDLRNDVNLYVCNYAYLVKKVVSIILNGGEERKWNAENISVVSDGDCQGTLLYLIPRDEYCPGEGDYLMTYVNYGSCSLCDTLRGIQDFGECDGKPQEEQVKGYMALCKDLVCNMVKPYNYGWRNEEDFDRVGEEGDN